MCGHCVTLLWACARARTRQCRDTVVEDTSCTRHAHTSNVVHDSCTQKRHGCTHLFLCCLVHLPIYYGVERWWWYEAGFQGWYATQQRQGGSEWWQAASCSQGCCFHCCCICCYRARTCRCCCHCYCYCYCRGKGGSGTRQCAAGVHCADCRRRGQQAEAGTRHGSGGRRRAGASKWACSAS